MYDSDNNYDRCDAEIGEFQCFRKDGHYGRHSARHYKRNTFIYWVIETRREGPEPCTCNAGPQHKPDCPAYSEIRRRKRDPR